MNSLASHLEKLENAQLVRRLPDADEAFLFKHALTQESAYESILLRNRREIHRRVAEAYERVYRGALDEYADVLAEHYRLAGDHRRTVDYAVRAGNRAAGISAYREAKSHFSVALTALSQLPADERNREATADTLLMLIRVSWGINSTHENLEYLFRAESLAQSLASPDRTRLARVHTWLGRVYSYANDQPKALEYYRRVLTEAEQFEDSELYGLALALGGRTFHLQGNFREAVPLLEQALPHLERIGNWTEWILSKVSLAISLAGQGHYQEGRRHGDEAIRKALGLNDLTSIATARAMAARVEFMAGDPQRMLDEVQGLVAEVSKANPLIACMGAGFEAWAWSRVGNPERAHKMMSVCHSLAVAIGPHVIFEDWFAAASAEIELDDHRPEAALSLAEEAISRARPVGGIFSEGIAERIAGQALAELGGPDAQVDAHLAASLARLEAADAAVEAARTRMVWGRVLMARGEIEQARAYLGQAAEHFGAFGLATELNQAREMIDSLESRRKQP